MTGHSLENKPIQQFGLFGNTNTNNNPTKIENFVKIE
jgi:hypothetical protein